MRQRIEAETGTGGVWVTAGYTIENYVPPAVLAEAVAAIQSNDNLELGDQMLILSLLISSEDAKRRSTRRAIAQAVVGLWQAGDPWPLT